MCRFLPVTPSEVLINALALDSLRSGVEESRKSDDSRQTRRNPRACSSTRRQLPSSVGWTYSCRLPVGQDGLRQTVLAMVVRGGLAAALGLWIHRAEGVALPCSLLLVLNSGIGLVVQRRCFATPTTPKCGTHPRHQHINLAFTYVARGSTNLWPERRRAGRNGPGTSEHRL